jgi:hypothetical protein
MYKRQVPYTSQFNIGMIKYEGLYVFVRKFHKKMWSSLRFNIFTKIKKYNAYNGFSGNIQATPNIHFSADDGSLIDENAVIYYYVSSTLFRNGGVKIIIPSEEDRILCCLNSNVIPEISKKYFNNMEKRHDKNIQVGWL